MKNGTDQKRPPTAEQFGELSRVAQGKLGTLLARYFCNASFDEIQVILKGGEVGRKIDRQLAVLFANADPHHALRTHWEKIYRDDYGLEADFTGVYIPPLPTYGKWRHLFILGGLTMNHAAAVYNKIIRAYNVRWSVELQKDNLDVAVTDNIRTSLKSYVICVRDDAEPDKHYLGKPMWYKPLGETLLERLVHGTVHFIETKKHLDEIGRTLCIGSRYSDGRIPLVGWHGNGQVEVGMFNSDYGSFRVYGPREVVSGTKLF